MTNEEAMGILYSHSRINPKIGCEQRFIAYQNGDVEKALDIAIKAIEQTTWIPCSKRLPETGERVLVLFDDGFVMTGSYLDWEDGTTWMLDGQGDYNVDIDNIIAWMPLPPSYQGE